MKNLARFLCARNFDFRSAAGANPASGLPTFGACRRFGKREQAPAFQIQMLPEDYSASV
ncbi:MAG: hypothetical protein HZC43_05795 [Nitrosomonadales bacterium]|nr:hypothetical protein [Nitrosomonadales bacterium]